MISTNIFQVLWNQNMGDTDDTPLQHFLKVLCAYLRFLLSEVMMAWLAA